MRAKSIDNIAVLSEIRQNEDGRLLVPVKKNQDIIGVQFINADGRKIFNRGVEKQGNALLLGKREDCYNGFAIAEGFATAATVATATGKPCIVAFDAGNLPAVANRLKGFVVKNSAPVVLCADKDANDKGENYAKKAAAILGTTATVITPDFTDKEIQQWQTTHNGKIPTDFNDLQAIGGIERVRAVIAINGKEIATTATQSRNDGNLSGSLNENKLLIQVYGSPATGKSWTAQNLTSQLQEIGIDCEYVSEYATDLIRQGRADELKDQIKVTSEQRQREQDAFNRANIVITDSPTLLGVLYSPENQKAQVAKIAAQSQEIAHIDILLRHNSESLAVYSTN